MSEPALPAMGIIFNEVCVLVTAAFALTLLPGFRQPERSLLSRHDQGTALVVFLILGLVEEMTFSHAGWFNERIVAVCVRWSGRRSLGRTGRQSVCDLVGGCPRWLAARVHCDFHVLRRSSWGWALPLAPKAGATPNNGILSDLGGNVASERPHFPLGS
jgi:hypothetical protein